MLNVSHRTLAVFILSSIFSASARAAGEKTLLERGDQLYGARTVSTGAPEALALYEQVIAGGAPNGASGEALWKAARACYWIADHAEKKREKISMFEKGIGLAKKAVDAEPGSVDAHFWLAGLWGSYGEAKGILKSLALVKPIRRELNEINRLNDRYQGGAGYRVLGIVDYKVPGFAGGNKKRAQEQLNKALGIDPSNAFNQYYAAEFYGTVGRDKKRAVEHLDALDKLPPTHDVDAQDLKMMRERGRRLRGQIGT